MNLAEAIPLLGRLNKIELAKLVPDMNETEVSAGAQLSESWCEGHVFFVLEGQLELLGEAGRPLLYWQRGDIVQVHDLPNRAEMHWSIRAMTAAELVSIPVERFAHLLESNPRIAHEYRSAVTNQMSTLLRELNRTRGILANYAEELWRDIPPVEMAFAAAAAEPVSRAEPVPVEAARRRAFPWAQTWAIGGTVLGGVLAMTGQQGLIHQANVTMGLLVAGAANWLAGIIPDFAVALGISIAAILLNLAKPSVALSGFVSPTWFTLLAVWVIGAAVNRTGLLYRLALRMLNLLPPTYMGQSIALAITGFVTTPFLPSGQSRVVMVAPLVKELAEAMGYKRNSRAIAGLGMNSLIGFGLMYFMFLNGSTLPLLAYSLLPPDVQPGITWIFWLTAALPLGIFVFVASYVGISVLLPPEPSRTLTRDVIRKQLRILGPISKMEWITSAVLAVTLIAFAVSGFIGFEPAWVAMAGMLVLVGFGILDREGLKRSVDWGFLLFFGSVLSFANVARSNGVDVRISEWIIPLFHLFKGSSWLFVAGVAMITFLVRLVIPAVQSVPLLLIALTPVAVAVGVNPFVVSLVVLTMGTNFIIPQQSPFYMALHAGMEESFTHKQIIRVGFMHAVVMFVGLVASVPYWHWLGLMP